MIEFANCLIDRNVFPSFLMSTDLTSHVDNEDVISDFLKVRKKDKGKKKTNVIGWHSNIKLQDPEYPFTKSSGGGVGGRGGSLYFLKF